MVMSKDQSQTGGAERVPDDRLGPQVQSVDRCRECGKRLAAGYLCDECDEVTFAEQEGT